MDRKWKSGAAVAAPTLDNASDGYATEGNPGTGTAATVPGAHWFHMVTEEILSVLTAAAVSFDKAVVTQLRDAIYALIRGTTQTITSTGTQNDYAVTAARRLILRCNNASLLTFNGFAAGQDGDEIDVVSVGAGQVDIADQAAGSSATNRVINGLTATISLAAGVGRARLRYDGTTGRWRVREHEQGTWIAGSALSLATSGGGSLSNTVSINNRYWLKGRTLTWSLGFSVDATGVCVSANPTLPHATFLLGASARCALGSTQDSSSGYATGTSGQGSISIFRNAGNLIVGSNTIHGTYIFELQ